jgi:hypothetical protein
VSIKVKKAMTRTSEKQSRAALATIESAVATVAEAVKQLGLLQRDLSRAHRAALESFQVARHHPLTGHHLEGMERLARTLADRRGGPSAIRDRAANDHLERPLSHSESWQIGRWASSAAVIAAGLPHLGDTVVDEWYGDLVASAADAARSALPKVTVEAHKRRAARLMLRLDHLCSDVRIAQPLAATRADEERVDLEEVEDPRAQCGRLTKHWLH